MQIRKKQKLHEDQTVMCV